MTGCRLSTEKQLSVTVPSPSSPPRARTLTMTATQFGHEPLKSQG
jgi:hypothetical protein